MAGGDVQDMGRASLFDVGLHCCPEKTPLGRGQLCYDDANPLSWICVRKSGPEDWWKQGIHVMAL
jgi:hypothetical protein